MKKTLLAAVAAGALAAGGAASAQDLGTVISNIFGFGTPQYGYNYGGSQPAVVAGTQYGAPYGTQVYSDQYGRRFYYDQYGRQVMLNGSNYGSTSNYGIVGYDSWGRPVYGNTTISSYPATPYPYGNYSYNNWDRDGDGIANTRDRWPDDRRYW